MNSENKPIPIPLIREEEVAESDLWHTAFLSHERTEKRTVLDLLLEKLRHHGIPDEKVFYDEYMKRGGNVDENQMNRLKNELLASEYMVVFLTAEFLRKPWPMWELKTFLEMMKKDKRRKLLPIFYRLSAGDCKSIAKKETSDEVKKKLGSTMATEEVVLVMEKVTEQFGIDAEGKRLSDKNVAMEIMKNLFDVDIQEKASDMHEKISDFHNPETCTRSLCRHPLCEKINKLNLDKEFKTPNLPAHTQLNFENAARPESILKDNLLSKQSSGTVAALGIRGLGGVGKTTCLIGVASCREVKNGFKDGIFWIQLSMHTTSDNIRSVLHNMLAYAYYHWGWRAFESDLSAEALLNPKVPLEVVVQSIEAALKDRKCLLVLDDFWQFQNYENIVQVFVKMLTPSSRILLSTRFSDVAKQFNAETITVKDLDDETASSLFDKWCEWKPESEEEERLKKEILRQCSNLAFAVCIAGSNVRRIAKSRNIKHGLERVLGDLNGNLANLQRLVHMREDQTLNAVIQTSIDSIADEGHKNGYQCLAVFNNKTRVPEQALKALWMTDAANVEARVDLYLACSLATRKVIYESGYTNSFHVEFHDQHLAYAKYSCRVADERLRAGKRGECWKGEILASLHAQLVDGYKELRNDGNGRIWWEAEHLNDGYFHENYAHHLGKSRRIKDLVMLLTDYRWIAIRCGKQEITGLLGDFDHAISMLRDFQKRKGLNQSFCGGLCDESSESSTAVDRSITSETALNTLGLVRAALRSSQAIQWERKDEVSFQVVGRLLVHSSENILIKRLIDGARQWEQRPWLCPVTQCLESPMSGALQVLRANSPVLSVAVCHKNSHLVACGTFDGNVRLWDWNSGRSLWTKKGHQGGVGSVAVTEDGSVVVSGSNDGTVRLWDGKSGECKGVLEGHQVGVGSVAVTEDGSVVVSGSDDGTVRLWDGKSGECKGVLEGHQDWVRSVAVTEDGSVVVSGSDDWTVRLWDGKSGECKGVLEGHQDWVRSVAVTEDGSVVVSGSNDGTVRLWDGKSGECKGVLERHQRGVGSVAVTEDRSVVVSGSNDGTVRLWDGKSGECKGVLEGHQGWVGSVAVTEDGSVVVLGSNDGTVRLWDGKSGECKGVLEGHQDWVGSVAVTEDGSVVVSGSDDGTVRLWDGKSGECKGVPEGHQGWVGSVAVTEDGSVVVSGSNDGTVRLWDGKSGECKGVLEGHQVGVGSVAVTEDGSVVVSGSNDGTVRLWDGKSGECKGVLEGHQDWVRSVAVTEDGSVVVSGSDDWTVRLWDGKSGECKGVLEGHQDWVRSVAVTEDGSVVVSGSNDGTVRLWDGKSGECKGVLERHQRGVGSVAVTEDRSVVVSGSNDGTVRLWDGKSGECKGVPEGHQGWVGSVAVTEDGSVVVLGSNDGTVRLWDGKSGECKGVLEGHQDWVGSVAVTEDGSVVVSGSNDGTVRLWDGKSGECKGVLEGHQGWVGSVAVTEDGSVVVSGSDDGTVRLWDGKSGECKGVPEGHQVGVGSVAVTEDGSVVVSGSDDGTVRLWDGKSGECKGVLEGHQDWVGSVAVTEDGSVVVSGSNDGTVRLWDGKSGECKGVLEGHQRGVGSVAVTEDGSVVVSGSDDWTVRLWDGKSGECKGALEGHQRGVRSVAVTEDGSVVVSWSDDGTVRLWDGKSGGHLKSASMDRVVMVGSRDFLRWARLIGLLKTQSEVDFSDPATYEMTVESGVVTIVQGIGTVMSATFDNTGLFAFVINSKVSPRVIVLGSQLFVLEITNM